MRVLDIDNNYSPTGGGVRTYHEQKLAWYRERDDTPYGFVVPSDHFERSRDGRATVYHVPAVPLGGSGYRFVIRQRHVTRVMGDFAPDVVEIGSPYVLPRLVSRGIRATGRPIATVGFYHSDVPDTLVRPFASRLGVRAGELGTGAATRWIGRTYAEMTAMFGASCFVLDKLADAGVRRLFHTPLGVDVEVHSPTSRSDSWRREVGAGDERALVLYLARVAPEKGIRRLFEAYPLVRDPERLQLVVVGHGPLDDELDAFTVRFPEVRRLPYMSERRDVARAYASADVFLSLGAVETFSLSTAEALASGTPVVAPDGGGAGEQVAELTPELLFEPDDAASLAGAIHRALAVDEDTRRRIRDTTAARRSWTDVFDREHRCYRRIVDAERAGDLSALVPAGRWWPADPEPQPR